ncbi:hypothetical protein PVA45_07815 (plasmid) [Entomospira entomophila]|uniref:Uncharacterized protein n=1 Tax=Entomospira entomophila TaxID=2719988 RepID=A0A968GBN3_9SPIO|nr:hypothetical protein [Entomospira entomophilus]NIZ41410.1 hypothetical protein [Entomospira entomophilus]WDI36360.1 hypothetical protein PVA45_07815 [Entomospira entomophilus]
MIPAPLSLANYLVAVWSHVDQILLLLEESALLESEMEFLLACDDIDLERSHQEQTSANNDPRTLAKSLVERIISYRLATIPYYQPPRLFQEALQESRPIQPFWLGWGI